MSHTNDRLDNTIELIQTDHQAVSQLTSVLSTDVHLLATALNRTTSLVANTTISLAILTSELDTLHQGLIHLLQDRLTSNIVPISVLKSTLMHITSHLANSHPNLALTHPTVHYYYRHGAFVASLKNNAVFITLNFPVSPIHYKFTLFHVSILPVPVNHTSVHATQVVHVPAYIAIAQDRQSFIELTNEQYMQCEGDTIKHCPMLIAQQPLNIPTCLSSVFFQQTSDVTKVCDFHYLHNGLKTMVTRVDFKTLLLTNVSSLTYQYSSQQPITGEGCKYCFIHIPCNCALTIDRFFIPPRIKNCLHGTNVTKLFPFNLALLQFFFSDKELGHIVSDTSYAYPLNYTIPNFNIYQHQFTQLLASDHDLRLNLSKMVTAAKLNQSIYSSLVEPILSGDLPSSTTFTFSPWHFLTAGLPTFLSVIAVILSLKVFLSNRAAASLMLTQTIPTSKAAPILHWHPSTTPSTTTIPFTIPHENISLALHVITVIFLCILAIHYIHRSCSNLQNKTKMFITLSNGNTSTSIFITHLPLSPVGYRITGSKNIAHFTLSYKCTPHLLCSWNVHLQDIFNSNIIDLPPSCAINPLQWPTLKHLLCTDYQSIIHFSYKQAFEPAIWDNNPVPTTAGAQALTPEIKSVDPEPNSNNKFGNW